MKFIESILSNKLEYYSKFYSDIKFIVFTFSIVTILSFLLVYNFLYGYYFGGDISSSISNFNIISNFIPFDFRTISMTSFYFICIFYVIFGFISLWKHDKKDKKNMLALLISVVILITIMLAVFFSSELTLRSIFSFFLIWLFFGLMVWVFFIFIKIISKPTIVIKSSFLTFFIWLIISILLSDVILEKILLKQILFLILLLLWPLITTLLIFIKDKNLMIFFSSLPFSFIVALLSIYLLTFINIKLNVYWLIVFIFIINIPTYYTVKFIKTKSKNRALYKKKSNETDKSIDIGKDDFLDLDKVFKNEKGVLYNILLILYKVIVEKKEKGIKMFVGMILLMIFVITPQVSIFCGKGIRTINTTEGASLEILYVNQDSVENSVIANYYIESNSVLYISNEQWQLEVIKPENYHIRSISTETNPK